MGASSLIYAAEAGIMSLIFKLFDEVVIPSVVAHETTRKREKPDAQYILRLINSGKLKVVDIEPIDSETLGLGERTAISLALEEDPKRYMDGYSSRRLWRIILRHLSS